MMIECAHLLLIMAWLLHIPIMLPAYTQLPAKSVAKVLVRYQNLQLSLLVFVVCALFLSFLQHDFSVNIVAQHSSTSLPWYYCLSALWGGHEGSLLLWIVLLAVWRTLFVHYSRMLDTDTIAVASVLAFISFGIMAFLLFASNPLERILPNAPLEGHDLNALLQDVGMATHPPMLYMGYVAFAVPYAFAIVMLWRKKLIEGWQEHMRFWVLLAWSCLGVGIALGSWWAYRELGWGGWWFWDPVENASLMPWLGGTLLLHALAWSKRSEHAYRWALLLALLCFILSLLGTFLVRSGVLVSVHSFAADPQRGIWILGLMLVYGLLAFAAYSRSSWLGQSKQTRKIGYFEVNQGVIAAILLTVILGTLYPLVMDVLHLGKMSVGEPYYNLITPCLVLPGIIALLFWSGKQLSRRHLIIIASVIGLWSLLIGFDFMTGHPLAYLIALVSGLAVLAHGVIAWQWWRAGISRSWGMLIAHAAFLMLIFSIALAHTGAKEHHLLLGVGESTQVAGYDLELKGFRSVGNEHVRGLDAIISVSYQGKVLKELQPGRRHFSVSQTNLGRTDALITPTHDLYVALGNTTKDQTKWQVHIQYKPMVRWLWLSVIVMSLASLAALSQRREFEHRV